MLRHRIANLVKIVADVCGAAKIARFAAGEKKQFVEQFKRGCRRLVNARDDNELAHRHVSSGIECPNKATERSDVSAARLHTYIISLGQRLQVVDHLETGLGI